MAYSDYGGLGYRDGDLVETASDAVVAPDMTNAGSPGCWPGFGDVAAAMGETAFHELRQRSVDGHVVIGDGPVLVALHKQRTMTVHVAENGAFAEIDLVAIGQDLPDETVSMYGDGSLNLDTDAIARLDEPVRFAVDGHVIEWRIVDDPRLVQHVRLTQPDGTVWTAFSGAEIGVGHDEDATRTVAWRHRQIFPHRVRTDA